MSTGETLMTPDNAPRDEETLTAAGAFIHRRLAENLHARNFQLWSTDREKTAFLTASPADRARVLVQKLKEMDAAGGGTPAAPPSQPAAPPPPPPAEEAPAKRAPRTSGTATANPLSPPPQAPTGGVTELLLAMKAIGDQVSAVRTNQERLSGGIGTTDVRLKSLEDKLSELTAMLSATAQLQKVQLGLLCLFGQQVLGNVGISEFLPASVDDANAALAILDKMGKD